MKPRILIVDDNEDLRVFLSELLGRAGYKILEASNGEEALEQIQLEHPDLVVTDLAMPSKDGLEVLVTVHQNYPDTKVILTSGTYDEGLRQIAHRLGVFMVLFKPFRNEDMINAVAQALPGRLFQTT